MVIPSLVAKSWRWSISRRYSAHLKSILLLSLTSSNFSQWSEGNTRQGILVILISFNFDIILVDGFPEQVPLINKDIRELQPLLQVQALTIHPDLLFSDIATHPWQGIEHYGRVVVR